MPRIGRSRSCRISRWRTGWPRRSTSRARCLGEAERELAAGLAPQAGRPTGSRFNAVALHWLLGLIHLARGDETRALEEFERELSFEHAGQLYARECAANTWYAIGALRLRQGRPADARAAFARAHRTCGRAPDGARRARGRGRSNAIASRERVARAASRTSPSMRRSFRPRSWSSPALTPRPRASSTKPWPAPQPATRGGCFQSSRCCTSRRSPDIWARVLAHLRNRAT